MAGLWRSETLMRFWCESLEQGRSTHMAKAGAAGWPQLLMSSPRVSEMRLSPVGDKEDRDAGSACWTGMARRLSPVPQRTPRRLEYTSSGILLLHLGRCDFFGVLFHQEGVLTAFSKDFRRSANELPEERVRPVRARYKFGMELRSQHEGVARNLRNLDE